MDYFAGRTLFEPGDPRLFGIAIVKVESLEVASHSVQKNRQYHPLCAA